jgi:hypothetical protein
MPDQRISVHDRVAALDNLERLAFELNRAAAWLGREGCESESDQLDHASTLILSACWLLERPIRRQPTPERWAG